MRVQSSLRWWSLGVLLPAALAAQQPATPWSVEEIHGPARKVAFTTDEGTWISLDVSPDGKTIVFDLLGDLYTIPITGGKATRLTSGTRWDAMPRYSPNGATILFDSDPSGSDQLWTMPAAGGTPTRVTAEGTYHHLQGAWDPSGSYVFALRQTRPFQPSDVVMVHVAGGTGTPVADTGAVSLVASADGRWLYHAYLLGEGATKSAIVRIDRRTGERLAFVTGYEDLRRPMPSPDGRWLAFAATIDAQPRLVVRNLESGADKVLYTGLDYPPGWGGDDLDELPGYAFTPDGASLVFAANGKMHRVAIATGVDTPIPFSVDVDLTVTERIATRHRLDDGAFSPKVLRWVQRIDASRFVVQAAGKLYRYDASTRQAAPVVPGTSLQYAPAVSPDGGSVAWVDWTDATSGRVMIAPAAGGVSRALGIRAGRYQGVSWSPDGKKLVLAEQRLEPDAVTEQGYVIHWVDVASADRLHTIVSIPTRGGWRKPSQRPTWNSTGDRIYYIDASAGTTLCSIALDGADRRCHARFKNADEIVPSPDGTWVAFGEMQNAYLAPLPSIGNTPVDINVEGGPVPTLVLGPRGDFFYWRNGGRQLQWSWANDVYEVDLAAVATGQKAHPATTTIALTIPRAIPKGDLVLRNARIITMKGDDVLASGDLVVSNGRIAAVGPAGSVRAPAGATSLDMTGKTIVPGFIDLHAHYIIDGAQMQGDLHQEQVAHLVTNLAYGITTWRDPSIGSRTLFALGEMVEAGTTIGPRLHGTGDIFIKYDPICCGYPKSLDDARRIVRNQKLLGATSIKEHTVPRRDHVQWIIQASREEGLQVVEDPARGPRRELRPLMDGATSLEHAYSALPMKDDVVQLFARTGTFYVPTLVVNPMESFFVTTMSPHDDAKLRRFQPHARIDAELHAHNRMFMPHEVPTWYAEPLKAIVRAGGKVGMGSHGQLQGLGAHWEMWAMASAGLTPMETLRAATATAAEVMGMQDDIGSLEVGKLADLLVLDRDPLADLKNTTSIRYVMKAGTLWNAETMDEVWPVTRVRAKGLWEERRD
ncbi:MAG: amidohydrolase family protein [Gemmatimonadaceae bacterium]